MHFLDQPPLAADVVQHHDQQGALEFLRRNRRASPTCVQACETSRQPSSTGCRILRNGWLAGILSSRKPGLKKLSCDVSDPRTRFVSIHAYPRMVRRYRTGAGTSGNITSLNTIGREGAPLFPCNLAFRRLYSSWRNCEMWNIFVVNHIQ